MFSPWINLAEDESNLIKNEVASFSSLKFFAIKAKFSSEQILIYFFNVSKSSLLTINSNFWRAFFISLQILWIFKSSVDGSWVMC